MRVLVCGGRAYADWDRLSGALDEIHAARPISLIIHGDATGADKLAKHWAIRKGIPEQAYPAEWHKVSGVPRHLIGYSSKGKPFNRAAGPQRNQQMLDEGNPDLVVAFPGGAGTADMRGRAFTRGVAVIDVEP